MASRRAYSPNPCHPSLDPDASLSLTKPPLQQMFWRLDLFLGIKIKHYDVKSDI